MKNKKILFAGCSLTATSGFTEHNQSIYHWPMVFSKHFNCYYQNVALTGCPNEEIFLNTIENVVKERYDLVVIMWSSIGRYWFYPADHNIDDYIAVPSDNTALQYQKLYHAHFNNQYMSIKKWLSHIVALQNMFENFSQKFVFIKGFDNHLNDFIKVNYNNGYENIDSIKYMLDFDQRPDAYIWNKISIIKDLIHRIDQHTWVNFNGEAFCQSSYEVDKADDNDHPGRKTNINMATDLINHCINQNIFE